MAEDRMQGAQDEVSFELDALVCDLLDGVLDALANGEDLGVALIVEDAQANRYQVCFTEDGPEECLAAAQSFVASHAQGIQGEHVGPVDRYALAYAGGVELDGVFEDAVIVSFYQRGMSMGYSAYVLYAGAGSGDDFTCCDPQPAGEEPPLL